MLVIVLILIMVAVVFSLFDPTPIYLIGSYALSYYTLDPILIHPLDSNPNTLAYPSIHYPIWINPKPILNHIPNNPPNLFNPILNLAITKSP